MQNSSTVGLLDFQSYARGDWFSFLSFVVLFLTFCAIVWYTVETRRLRQWQTKQLQLSVLDVHLRIAMHSNEMFSKGAQTDGNIVSRRIPNMLNDIYKHGKFDLKDLYAGGVIKDKED